jgi:multicomponent Na+:H+ antiporter subunit F
MIDDAMQWVLYSAMALLVVALLLTLLRLVWGPSLPDRVLALDLMATIAVSLVAVYAMMNEVAVLLDVAVVLALIAFLGTVAFSLFIERRLHQ